MFHVLHHSLEACSFFFFFSKPTNQATCSLVWVVQESGSEVGCFNI